VPDKQTGKYLHSETLRSAGGNVKEYDFGRNEVGQLGEKFDTVFASNVLNVQADRAMLDSTLSQIWSSVGPDGRAVFNYPASPRYLDMRPSEVAAAIKDVTGITPQRVGGTSSTPLWEVNKKQQIRFSPARTAAERRAAEMATEERKYGMSSREVPVSMILNEGEEISRAMNEIISGGTPTFTGKVQDPELAGRIATSQAVLEGAAQEDALGRKVNAISRKRQQIQRRQAEIQAAVAKREAEGTIGPVPVGLRPLPAVKTFKELGDLPGGGPTKLQPELKVTPEQLRQVFRNLDVEEFPTPQEAPPAVTDLISQKTPRSEITQRTVLGNIQTDAAKAARVGDMKIDQMLKAMSDKREAMFDAELARVRNKFDTMELQGKAEEARQAGIDPEIVRRRNEHFANVQGQIAQAAEPAPLNSGTAEPPAQTLLPNMATAADDPRIPRDIVIQAIRGKFKIWSIGRQSVQAVTDTYQEALKKAQAIQLKRRKKQNAT
jgi:hypothetical protein